jgi:hypothetical protein
VRNDPNPGLGSDDADIARASQLQHAVEWSKHWSDSGFGSVHGTRCRYPHRYPDTHPQAKSNPKDSWCYPLTALGDYREWLEDTYIEDGKFGAYLKGKVSKGELPPSIAQLAISAIVPAQITGPAP